MKAAHKQDNAADYARVWSRILSATGVDDLYEARSVPDTGLKGS